MDQAITAMPIAQAITPMGIGRTSPPTATTGGLILALASTAATSGGLITATTQGGVIISGWLAWCRYFHSRGGISMGRQTGAFECGPRWTNSRVEYRSRHHPLAG